MNFVIVDMRIGTLHKKLRRRRTKKDKFLDKCTFCLCESSNL